MPNEFLTSKQVVERMMDAARETVGKMPLPAVQQLWDEHQRNRTTGVGIDGSIFACVLIAARERLGAK